ncbi:hypothetical protein ACIQTU_15565 [Brevundimonas sp. NPDC090276]|uniref:hypothetical protein n=1 Tax=Brevundimonas sp. NPDC090276 TaxID=3363956 RepID=UPI00383A3F00
MGFHDRFSNLIDANIEECSAFLHASGQPFRIVFRFVGGGWLTIQSGLQDDGEEIGFLTMEDNIYSPDVRSLKAILFENVRITDVIFYRVSGCQEPSRMKLALDSGQEFTVSSDAFPYGLSYSIGNSSIGMSQFDDVEYLPCDVQMGARAR